MKVEQKGVKYSPITITLETEKEAKALSYLLSCAEDVRLNDHLTERGLKSDAQHKISDTLYRMCCDYENVYCADDDC